MSLSKVLEEIKKVKPLAEENTEDGPVETLNARRGRKARAIEDMKLLKFNYTENLRKTACFIVVTGSKREEFLGIAVEKNKCFTTNPDEFYEDLANRVSKTANVIRTGTNDLIDIMGRHLEDKARDLGVVGYPMVVFKQEYRTTITSQKDFTALVKRAINDQVGAEMVGLQAVKSLTDAAIEKKHKALFTPILLPIEDESFTLTVLEDLKRLTPRVYLVVAGDSTDKLKAVKKAQIVEEPAPGTVKSALTAIGNTLK